jgi:hypothetical protein
MLKDVVALGLTFEYLVFDTHYTAGWFTKMVARLGCLWQGTLSPRTHVVWRGQKQRSRTWRQVCLSNGASTLDCVPWPCASMHPSTGCSAWS